MAIGGVFQQAASGLWQRPAAVSIQRRVDMACELLLGSGDPATQWASHLRELPSGPTEADLLALSLAKPPGFSTLSAVHSVLQSAVAHSFLDEHPALMASGSQSLAKKEAERKLQEYFPLAHEKFYQKKLGAFSDQVGTRVADSNPALCARPALA